MIWMTARRFDWALRTRGCALSTWPEAERDSALRLLRRSAAARQMLADAFSSEDGPEDGQDADAPALDRMQGVVHRALRPPTPLLRGLRWGAIVACAAAGLYLGFPALEQDVAAELGPTMQVDVPSTVLAALD